MATALRQRQTTKSQKAETAAEVGHPGGEIKHGGAMQILRLLLFLVFFASSSCTIWATQVLGFPLYWVNRDLYYAYISLTKRSYGVFSTTLTQLWAPTVVRVSWDSSLTGHLWKTADGRLECSFPERMIMIANHQLYSDWLYLWWVAYTNRPQMHGHIFIILKESLKWIPIIGWGMQFYGFVFMSRKMAKDQPRLAHRLKQLKERHSGPLSGSPGFDPMWLLIFPEGTNATTIARKDSAAWAEKVGIKDMEHQVLPRSTGLFFCLNELKGTLDYVYDCTVAYEGVPRGEYGADLFTLRSIYLQGRPPPSVNMYWRRFAVAEMPLEDHEKFNLWLRERWYEKDAFMEQYMTTGRLPSSKAATNGREKPSGDQDFIETEVKLAHWWEVGQIFAVLATFGLIANILARVWNMVLYGKQV